jgi:hypothetical protein
MKVAYIDTPYPPPVYPSLQTRGSVSQNDTPQTMSLLSSLRTRPIEGRQTPIVEDTTIAEIAVVQTGSDTALLVIIGKIHYRRSFFIVNL